jgi:hypothetical protein
MTERIDLDDVDTPDETDDDERDGDWLWRKGEEIPEDRPDAGWGTDDGATGGDAATDDRSGDAGRRTAGEDDGDGGGGSTSGAAGSAAEPVGVPHVPDSNENDPVGIPMDAGGAGAGSGGGDAGTGATPGVPEGGSDGSGGGDGTDSAGGGTAAAHGAADPDDVTMAFTYGAVGRLAEPAAAVADAERWCDWLGLVGDVSAHVLNKFQRERHLDLDFFNGSGTGPGERLAEVDEHSMFFADRMAVVGLPDEEWIAERAGWEFVPLEHAAGEAGWELTEADGTGAEAGADGR